MCEFVIENFHAVVCRWCDNPGYSYWNILIKEWNKNFVFVIVSVTFIVQAPQKSHKLLWMWICLRGIQSRCWRWTSPNLCTSSYVWLESSWLKYITSSIWVLCIWNRSYLYLLISLSAYMLGWTCIFLCFGGKLTFVVFPF